MATTTPYKHALNNIKGRLMGTHQHQAVKWMLEQEMNDSECPGGLLALDMDLGKSYVTIATMKGNDKVAPTLIITPVSILHQWRDLLVSFGGIMPLMVDTSMGIMSLPSGVDVVLTTYSLFMNNRRKGLPGILTGTRWGRVVLDEGHVIKNSGSKTFENINALQVGCYSNPYPELCKRHRYSWEMDRMERDAN